MSANSFDARAELALGDRRFEIFRLDALQARFDVARLPFSLKILLENLLRTEGNGSVDGGRHRGARALGRRAPSRASRSRSRRRACCCRTSPACRSVVDLAAMRDAIAAMGGDPREDQPARAGRARDRPLGAGRRVRHRATRSRATPSASSSATPSATRSCAGASRRSSASRSCRPTPASCTRSTSSTSRASCSSPTAAAARCRSPTPTRSSAPTRTRRWSTASACSAGASAGIEAEAAMLGQPMSMLLPQVVGFRLHGALREGATATDLVLTVTEMLRAKGVVGRFVEFFGAGPRRAAARRPRDDRQHVAGVRLDLRDLPDRRRDAALPALHRPRRRSRSSWSRPTPASRASGTTSTPRTPVYSDTLELDLGDVEPSLAGPAPAPGPRAAERTRASASTRRWRRFVEPSARERRGRRGARPTATS